MKITMVFVLAFAIATAASLDTAAACTCLTVPGSLRKLVQAEKQDCTAVFLGTVTDIRTDSDGMQLTVRFSVERVWKGPVSSELTVTTHAQTDACGVPFTLGRRFIVYARSHMQGPLSTYSCSRTRSDADGREDFRYLGRSQRPPVPTTTPN